MILSINSGLASKDAHSIGVRATSESVNMGDHIATTPKRAGIYINNVGSKRELDAIFQVSATPDQKQTQFVYEGSTL